ncbi:hypothetical protein [Ectobacillus ponti]|uniref:Nicotinamidase n=1 Tax=Ectobacillus ponti TaxID=2961894 RepID=A0AA41XEF2_9BACI|nr:hypothetical protein [Ectobacillus ponti]MCP8970591.1 hypothetical protein [Ectobacillus ponti]
MNVNYEDIVDVQSFGKSNSKRMNDLLRLAAGAGAVPADQDEEKVLFLAIDMQNDFMEHGELAVPGSYGDVERATRFIHRNFHAITDIAVSLDTHQPQQIFHPCWWEGQDGEHPAPFTIITAADVEAGVWRALYEEQKSLEYVRQLERLGRKQLCIWTYHCLEGTGGAALEPQFANMVYFHSVARQSETKRIVKGQDPLSEMYGIIRPEYSEQDEYDTSFLEELQRYSKIMIAGEAKSHCVLESVRQIAEYYRNQPEVTARMYLFEDCMSSIPGFEEATEREFGELREQYGMQIVKSTELSL